MSFLLLGEFIDFKNFVYMSLVGVGGCMIWVSFVRWYVLGYNNFGLRIGNG